MKPLYNLRLLNHSSIVIAGPSLSGKTVFTRHLIANDSIMFNSPFKYKYWFSAYKPKEEEKIQDVHYEVGVPDSFDHLQPDSVVVLDDLMNDIASNKAVTNLITRGVHHRRLCVIILTQNLYQEGGHNRTRNLNTHYLIMFKNPRNAQQIASISHQMFPGQKDHLVKVYETATKMAHGYLLIDLCQTTDDALRLRAHVLPHEKPMYAYVRYKDYRKL